MQQVLTLIEQKKQEYAQLALFSFMQNKSINPIQRLAWAPCAAHFIMNFGELNKYFLRVEPTNDPIQALINKHTYEDDHHWLWFLEDLKNLELDKSLKFSDALKFLWSEETKNARYLNYQLYRYTSQATPIQKIIVIEVTEATGNIMFSTAAEIGKEIKAITQKPCRYFADFHLNVETGHMTSQSGIEQFLQDIQLSEATRQEAYELVENLFTIFTQFTNELLVYAETHKVEQQLKTA
ncbi:hypothetical protein [Nostoc sp. 'Lobaria pulmonaria (5183) cyanobiont']|uniref:hypothetical protein n=1 Tax=Nostoc sp. 'Lobaria pulmonaria (5183) cyanobiont' TaxID=1618022 RepID=UPI000CF33207|nr:hypothetical protein [Nostoc sp. 'Lobaria pulmonaria (5183) cyanobiont']AVH72128.1 hypothetical protein NLP_3598 [Nostoc sp. 'Lobaria pulmonaria (5183) cyanobiont']